MNQDQEKMFELCRVAPHIAEDLAEIEDKLKFCRRAQGRGEQVPECIVENLTSRLERKKEEINRHPFAKAFLPKARIIVRMRRRRKEAIEQTVLGRISKSLILLQLEHLDGTSFPGPHPLEGCVEEEAWNAFRRSIPKRKSKVLVVALTELIRGAIDDLVETDLPPAPFRYTKSDMVDVSKKTH